MGVQVTIIKPCHMLFKSINVAIVNGHTLFRKILKSYLASNENINVLIQSVDVSDLLSKMKDKRIDVLLMDITAPKTNGIEAIKNILRQYPDINILILSLCADIDILSDLMELGVHGFFSKDDDPEELINAIVSISKERIYRNKIFTEILYQSKQNNIKTPVSTSNILLNEREKEILRLLWEEKSNREIADCLFLSVRSIEKIRQDLKEKLGVRSTVGLIKYAIRKRVFGSTPELSTSLKY